MAIYKREPVVHKLPIGWNDMDAVKYNNINVIQGLKHVDNALIANQNSTYNCKNVYQDESGNLTVRPALRKLKLLSNTENIEILGYYKTIAGDFVHTKERSFLGYNYYLRKFPSDNNAPVLIGEGNISIQESDNNVYIFYTDAYGMLQLKRWNGSALVDFEPDILTNSPSSPISRLYNLLTDKAKIEIENNIDTNEKSFTVITEYSFENIYYWQELSNGDIIVGDGYAGNVAVYILRKTNEIYQKVSTSISFSPSSSDIIFVNDKSEYDSFEIAVAHHDTIYLYEINTKDYSIKFTSYSLAYTKGFASIDTGSGTFSTVAIQYKGSNIIVYDFLTNTTLYTSTVKFSSIYETAAAKNRILIVGKVSSSDVLNTVAVITFTGTFIEHKQTYHGDIQLAASSDTVWFLVQTDDYDTIHAFGRYLDTQSFDYSRRVSDSTKTGILFGTANGVGVRYDTSIDLYTVTTHDKDNTIVVDNLGVRSVSYKFGSSPSGITSDGLALIDSTKISIRSRIAIYNTYTRQVSDDFPVLSKISDRVLTSFYLDNIYWFVTKHRIFGTGVADEQFSIKYFDPRKYFHFDEELTGAIRISDSSFWVFHNKGAYLIYKSYSEVYDELAEDYIETITWLCTSTAESKGCDFENGLITLPVSNYVACVTSDDISSVQMRENVQTDDRILVPMTLDIQNFVTSLLNETDSIITGKFKYNALFFLNSVKENAVPVLVYNAATDAWWYWELPVNKVYQVNTTETNIEILARVNNNYCIYDLYTDYYTYTIGGLTWKLYADRLISDEPTKIDWFWESAILHFDTVDYKKQLLFTNFTFGERESSTVSFEYNFEVYDREYSDRSWTEVIQVVERAKTYSCKNIVSKFMYLQLYMKGVDSTEFEFYTRPKFSAISFKYRILPGGLL